LEVEEGVQVGLVVLLLLEEQTVEVVEAPVVLVVEVSALQEPEVMVPELREG
jgi:hypothetical protein